MAVRVCARVIMQLVIVVSAANFIVDADANVDHREEWVVKIQGGSQVASQLAAQSGYKHHGSVLGFKDTYIWLKDDNPKKRGNIRFTKDLNANSKIIWAEQQKIVKRHKRDYISLADLESERPLTREKRIQNINIYEDASNAINNKKHGVFRKRIFNDELWEQQWYLQDNRIYEGLPRLDLNVLPLYQRGITGRGVRIAVVDDGLEYTHDDLRNNYDPAISYDINENDNDPMPRYDPGQENRHGTRCAGEIAMVANNKKCGVGVAFEASIGGIKFIDGIVNDRVEGEALGYKPELVDIYSSSWGPPDNGKNLEAPGRLVLEAFERGVTKGRKGKGNIYVWASGNGGTKSDNCGCDGYVGSIYTVAIGSASQSGSSPRYGEKCPATLATTYSSGAYQDQMIATTDLRNTCTTEHTGTSASAPLAAGILALALQVNNNLTWRDIQHLIAWSSEYIPLRENPGWFKNAAGFWFNLSFGFGLMNAYALVMASYNWTTVPEKTICKVDNAYNTDIRLIYGKTKKLLFDAGNVCQISGNEIISLEHVEVEVNLKYSFRGALQMYLTAPSGTSVQILSPRKLDDSGAGFTKWKFMSVATWGEDPRGTWTLDIFDKGRCFVWTHKIGGFAPFSIKHLKLRPMDLDTTNISIGPKQNNGTIGVFTLILHGTVQIPVYRRNGPRIYSEEMYTIYDVLKSNSVEDTYNVDIIPAVFDINSV